MPSIIWSIIIVVVCSDQPVEAGLLDWMHFSHLDKIGHFGLYFILCITLLFGFYKFSTSDDSPIRSQIIIAVLISILYGIGIEILQASCFETRQFELLDILANSIGAIVGAFVFKKLLIKLI